MTQSQGAKAHSDMSRRRMWPSTMVAALRRWIDSALLSNSIVVYRVEDPYTESVPGEDRPTAAQEPRRYPTGEIHL